MPETGFKSGDRSASAPRICILETGKALKDLVAHAVAATPLTVYAAVLGVLLFTESVRKRIFFGSA